ncbi:glycosyltransferase family 4 protein [Alcanivorax sp. S6407]|uniref:glycosyltransferase family 4 protein n=1 Tax=Alcanivorax sp. S6407 TaxID=2926424 RepID=UPI001FF69F7F|nr:glycosyltransferase family 4 protein [Alcanivorax sp. S6407]MCK0155054.1 glycosyltransferase family 4 protein [Alcanivorax sp. S6407]
MKTRILLITRNMPPLVGGMERLNWHLADELAKTADIQIIAPKGAASIRPSGTSLLEVPLKPLPLFIVIAFIKALWITLRWKPDIILAGSGLTAPISWLTSKLGKSQSAAYLHGFDISVNHWLYRMLWRPSFKKIAHIIVNSTPTKTLALEAGVASSRIHVVHPGVILPSALQPEENIIDFKSRHGLTGKKILLSVGRLTTRKGLRQFVSYSMPSIVKRHPSTVLVIIGEPPKHSLGADVQTKESILAAADQEGLSDHIRFLGVITNNDLLATAYESADLHVFPVRQLPDDPEGFGMVAIEAAAHGLPTAAFATGGVIDAVKHGTSGSLVTPGDYSELANQITHLLDSPLPETPVRRFAERFSWHRFGHGILDAFRLPPQKTKG